MSQIGAFLRRQCRQITLKRVIWAGAVAILYFYLYLSKNDIVIDPISVPERYEKIGLNSRVLSTRIAQAIRGIEEDAHTRMKRDRLATSSESSMPDVEVPGTKVGLKTIVDVLRQGFPAFEQTHLAGAVVLPINEADLSKADAEMSLRIVRGKDTKALAKIRATAIYPQKLEQLAAELLLHAVNPYVLAEYRYVQSVDRDDNEGLGEALGILREIMQDSSRDAHYTAQAYLFFGTILDSLHNTDEAVANYQKALELDSRNAEAWSRLGAALSDQGKVEEAIAKYRKALELDPKDAAVYFLWGRTLKDYGKDDEAVAKFTTSLKLDPKSVGAFEGLGDTLRKQHKYEQAIGMYQRVIQLDPGDFWAYDKWADVLDEQGEKAKAAEVRKRKPVQ